jgi:hypothetical protein
MEYSASLQSGRVLPVYLLFDLKVFVTNAVRFRTPLIHFRTLAGMSGALVEVMSCWQV